MFKAWLSRWKHFLLQAFDVRTGESRRVWLMLFNVFLLIQCLWMVKPVVNAQFLSRVGIEKLPLVFLLVAITALVFSKPYSKLLYNLSLEKMITRTYVVSILALLGFGLLLQFRLFSDWMSYLLYIGVALFGLIITSQFWLLANLLFTSLEAKRLFGLIGAGAIAGGISGGYITSLLTQFIDSSILLSISAGMLLISLTLNFRIWREFLPLAPYEKKRKRSKTLHEYPWQLIRQSKHLTYLTLIIGLSILVAKLVEFQFSAIAIGSIHDPEKLTAFFGFWFSTANALAFMIQLLLTQRIVGFLGVGRSLFILPVGLIASTAAVLKAPVLWAGTILKVLDISLKQSINKAATELVILPVPMAIKSQAKTYIDVFVDTTATGIGGLMLILIINGFDLSVRAVSVLILFLISLWIFFVWKTRREYILAFQKRLGISTDLSKEKHSEAAVTQEIKRTLEYGSVDQILSLLEDIEESKNQGLMKEVIPLLGHESPKVRLAALSILYYYPFHSIRNDIAPRLTDPDDQVRMRAFACLLAHTRSDRVGFINSFLTHEDPAISGAALVGLATETRDNPKMQQQFNLEQRIRDKLHFALHSQNQEESVSTRMMILHAIGFGKIHAFFPMLREDMHDKNPAIAQRAIIAAGNTLDISFLRPLIFKLLDEEMRIPAQKALAKYPSDDVISELTSLVNEKEIPIELLYHLPALVKSMDTLQAIDFLFDMLWHHHLPALKLEALEALHAMKSKFPRLTIPGKRILPYLLNEAELYKNTLVLNFVAQQRSEDREVSNVDEARKKLIWLLEQKLDEDLKRIFWLLGLSNSAELILPLYNELRHRDPEVRISTVELLDNILDPVLKKAVIQIVEIHKTADISMESLGRMQIDIPTEASCYKTILEGNDEEMKAAVHNLLEAMKKPAFGDLN